MDRPAKAESLVQLCFDLPVPAFSFPATVKVDLAELELAIVNIAVNARDAMPNGGVFTVSAANMTANNDVDQNQQSADFVAIEFSDSGAGIPPDLLSKIFDPWIAIYSQ